MFRYKIKIEYSGTGISGWQRQARSTSIQEYIENAIMLLTKEQTQVVGSGRTDAGVHALGQYAHFDLSKNIATLDLLRGINHFLRPQAIILLDCSLVTSSFHARFSAKARTYRYIILNRLYPSVIFANRNWQLKKTLNLEKMIEGSQYLLGTHDFTSFRAASCQAKTAIKTLDYVKITQNGEFIYFEIKAKSFLHHMVRNIVGTLAEVGLEKLAPMEVKNILNAKNRCLAGPTAPASGLYFVNVEY